MLFACKVPSAVYSIQPYQPFHFSAKRPLLTAMLKIQNIAWIYRTIFGTYFQGDIFTVDYVDESQFFIFLFIWMFVIRLFHNQVFDQKLPSMYLSGPHILLILLWSLVSSFWQTRCSRGCPTNSLVNDWLII